MASNDFSFSVETDLLLDFLKLNAIPFTLFRSEKLFVEGADYLVWGNFVL
jgi:hypothetical protein